MSGNNCSFCKECDISSIYQNTNLSETMLEKLCEFIVVSSVVTVLHMIDIVICGEYKMTNLLASETQLKSARIFHIVSQSLLIIILPYITLLIMGALFYKVFCSVAIKRKDKRFLKFLDSFDVFYCLEEMKTTDIQGIIQSNTLEQATTNIKEKLSNLFTNYSSNKIFYRRNEEYGFYYWRRYSYIDLAHYVQTEDIPDTSKIKVRDMIKIDQTIPNQDEGLFKILITKDHKDNRTTNEYNITLKFHHSIKNDNLIEFVARFVENSNDCRLILHSTPASEDHDSPDAILDMITKLYKILVQSIEENKPHDNNNSTLNSMKAVKWTKSDENLLSKMKEVCDLNLAESIIETLSRVWNTPKR